jgi:hypothetical protein
MKSLLYVLTVSLALCSLIRSAPTGEEGSDKKRLQLKIVKHQPCTTRVPPNEHIRFSSMNKAPLVKDEEKGDGCYSIKGPVLVRKDIRGVVQIYVQARTGSKGPIEKCNKADKSNCGGVGSCVYCDVCSTAKAVEQTTSSRVSVESGGKPMDCENGVTAGNYTDIKISFCMPTKQEFLDAEGIDEDIWNQNSEGGHSFFMDIKIFNKAVNTMSSSELQKIATDDSDQIIGCHRLVGNVYE